MTLKSMLIAFVVSAGPASANAVEVVASTAPPTKRLVTTTDEARTVARVVVGVAAPSKPSGPRIATTSDEARTVARVVTGADLPPTKLAARIPTSTDQARGIDARPDARPAAPSYSKPESVACRTACDCDRNPG